MPYMGQQIQSGSVSKKTIQDYTHASKTFLPNAHAYAPKFKFLFHVYFDINPEAYNISQPFGIAVKSAKLPSYTIATDTLNQYNRKRIVQTKIKYSNVTIDFHDDNSNMITNLWRGYYNYYYKDGTNFGPVLTSGIRGGIAPAQGVPSEVPDASYNKRNAYSLGSAGTNTWNWGYIGEGSNASSIKPPFFKNITIFGFSRHQYTAYTLINPIIASFTHDSYNYSDGGGTMQMNMDIEYESVVYNEGNMDGASPGNIVQGFGSVTNYDLRTSPITPKGANSKAPGPDGFVDTSGGSVKPQPQRRSNPIDNSGQ